MVLGVPVLNHIKMIFFSGVIFALKVLTTHYSPRGMHYALGFIPVPSKYIYWAELGLIQLMVPNASFTGMFTWCITFYMHVISLSA